MNSKAITLLIILASPVMAAEPQITFLTKVPMTACEFSSKYQSVKVVSVTGVRSENDEILLTDEKTGMSYVFHLPYDFEGVQGLSNADIGWVQSMLVPNRKLRTKIMFCGSGGIGYIVSIQPR